ncbi:division plane positioning ATPase MipZ [Arthrobacter woluwensis]|uniref:Plasmid segregation oscillating ATPase ParF n=1 Tax=Arthrobacter woluwensis TaxID=156980 RepID=A0A1H4I6I6_9MICC|nr:division plane positioning ATPase MipZ [Arthrobacter woluwensis]SEB29573.1 plasmid segregation oscillating ATPase ParF [Arthrobacter woluwensis]
MIIVIGSEKGGVGKSTTVTNLSVELANRGWNVAVVDADRQRSTARWGEDREEQGHEPRIFVVEKLNSLHETLKELDSNYDVVLVDVAGKDSKEMRTAMTAAHQLLVLTQSSQFDLDTLATVDRLIEAARDFNPGLRVRGMLTRVPTNAWETESDDAREYLKDFPAIEPMRTVLYERKAYRDVVGEGLGVVEWKNAKAKNEIRNLAEELMS